MSREVLENYLSRSISMEGLLNGRGDLDDNIRMLKSTGAKFIGRSLCLWGGEANLLRNLERAKEQVPKVHAADPEMILQACIFEIVTTQVNQVPVPEWAFVALGLPVEKRNFRYADMLYPDGRRKDHWRAGNSVPDVSRPETKLWFYFLAASYIDLGIEAIHFGQTELMNGNDRDLAHYSQVLALIRSYAAKHARRHMVLCDSHVPSGGLVRDGQAPHGFPLISAADHGSSRQAAGGDPEGRFLRRHLRPEQGRHDVQRLVVRAPALSGRDRQLGGQQASGAGEAGRHLGLGLRRDHLVCAPEPGIPKPLAPLCLGLGAHDRPERPSPDARQPHDAIAAGRQAMVLRQQPQPGRPGWARRRGRDPRHLGGRRGTAPCRWPKSG